MATYGASDLIARSIGIISSPILTRLLTPAQYGATPTVFASWGPFATMQFVGMDSVVPYVLARGGPGATRRLVAACSSIALTASAITWGVFFIVAMLTGWLSELASASQFETAVVVASLLPLGWTTWTMLILRFSHKARDFALVNFVSRILPTVIILACLSFFPQDQRLLIAWTITLITSLVAAAFAMRTLLRVVPRATLLEFPGWRRARRLVRMGLALVPAAVMYSMFSIADRLVIAGTLGTEAVAVLAVGLALGSGGPMLSSWLGLALDPHLTRWTVGGLSDLDRRRLQGILSTWTGVLCGSSLLAAIILPYVTSILYPSAYAAASSVASIIFFTGVVTAMSRIAVGSTLRRLQIRYHLPIYATALGINVTVGLALVEALGVSAVAWSTLLSEVFILASWIVSDRLFLQELKIAWSRPLLIAIATGVLVLGLLQLPETLVATPLFATALGIPVGALVLVFIVMTYRRSLAEAFRSRWKKPGSDDGR